MPLQNPSYRKTRKLMMSVEGIYWKRISHFSFNVLYNCLLAWKLIGWMVLIKSCSFKVLAVAPIIWRPVEQLKPVKETIDKEVWRICRKWTSLTLSVCFAIWTFGFEGTNYLISKSFRYVVVVTAHEDEEDGSQSLPIRNTHHRNML